MRAANFADHDHRLEVADIRQKLPALASGINAGLYKRYAHNHRRIPVRVDDIIEKLKSLGLQARAYHGRNMSDGGHCVAAIVPELRDIALLGPELHPGFEIDNYAFEFIVYWPLDRLPETHELLEDQGE